MKDELPPDRLSATSEDTALRALLDAGRRERPTAEQLSAMAARLGPGGGPGAGGGAQAVAAKSTLGVAAKAIAALVVLASIGAGIAFLREPARSVPLVEPVHVTEALPAPSAPPTASEVMPTEAAPTAPATMTHPSKPTPIVHDDGDDLGNEVELVKRALAALPTDPARALALADEHQARYAGGVLRQEADVIAIEALVHLGRRNEAEARARAFRAAYPGSPDVRRIEAILSTP